MHTPSRHRGRGRAGAAEHEAEPGALCGGGDAKGPKGSGGDEGGGAQGGAGRAWRGPLGQQGVAAPPAARRYSERVFGERRGRAGE